MSVCGEDTHLWHGGRAADLRVLGCHVGRFGPQQQEQVQRPGLGDPARADAALGPGHVDQHLRRIQPAHRHAWESGTPTGYVTVYD